MPFPDKGRILYNINTLNEVICQVNFPAILKIESEIPAEYQERIRQEYPFFEEQRMEQKEVAKVPSEFLKLIPSEVQQQIFMSRIKTYEFASFEKDWILALNRSALSLSTANYSTWKDFDSRFSKPLSSLIDIYKPSFFSRIGLRYQNLIRRSVLNLEETHWKDLIQPYVLGPMSDTTVNNNINSLMQVMELELEGNIGKVKIQHGLVTIDDDREEQCYLIDMDFSALNLREVHNASEILKEFNRRAARAFRWCITNTLETALGPKLV